MRFGNTIGRGFGLSDEEKAKPFTIAERESTEAFVIRSGLNVRFKSRVALLEFNHPPLNVIDIDMMGRLVEALTDAESRPAISIIVMRGLGTGFSVGVDVAAHVPDNVALMLEKFHALIRAVVASKKVTIAAVHGHCLGGAAELAMVCDLVFTTESATWGFPEIRLGCFPPVAATALAALVGQKRAAELVLTGKSIAGGEAAAIRLANRAVAEEELEAVVDETIARLSGLSPATLALTKKAIYAWDSMHFDKGLARAEKIYLEELMKNEDMQEGIAAFLEKRDPRWK
jgi:cyclohexa-1,5-dienecarbonyl-CoA hydratase